MGKVTPGQRGTIATGHMGKGYNVKVAQGKEGTRGRLCKGRAQRKVGTTAELHNDTGSQGETDTKVNRPQGQMSTMAKCPKGHTRKGHKGKGSQG